MVKMLLLSTMRGASASVTRLVTSAGRCKKDFASCAVQKNLNLCLEGQQQKLTKQEVVQARRTISHTYIESVRKNLKLFSATFESLNSRFQAESNDLLPSAGAHKVSTRTSPATWLAGYNQRLSLFDGLLSQGRPELLACSNRHIGALAYSYRGLHLESARYCKIPKTFAEVSIADQRYGITYMSQLCDESHFRLKAIAHDHLKKLLRAYKVKVVKGPPKKYPDQGVFKSPLLTQVEKDIKHQMSAFRVPAILRYMTMKITRGDLNTPGVFRVSGNPDKVAKLKNHLEQNFYGNVPVNTSEYDIHDFATLFKDYLRDLPAKIISTEKFEIFPDIQDLDFETQQFPIMNIFNVGMTVEHRNALKYILAFLDTVAKRSDKNQMDIEKLASFFGPLFFKIGDVSPSEVPNKVIHHVNMARAWIFYHHQLQHVPHDLMEDLRKSFSSKSAHIKLDPKVFPEVPKHPPVPKHLENITSATINVLTPYEKQPFKEITIGEHHIAKQVVCEVLGVAFNPFDIASADAAMDATIPLNPIPLHDLPSDLPPAEEPEQYLYEVGGNMGERCLSPGTKMLDLYRRNPKAHWVLKTMASPAISKGG